MDKIGLHENCIELLEQIKYERLTKKHLTESYFNVKNHFPDLADKYISQINEITEKIHKLNLNYKSCLKLLTNKSKSIS